MQRRLFLKLAALAPLAGCTDLRSAVLPVAVYRPGMADGHRLRDAKTWPAPSAERRVDTLIIGSGLAALGAAWQLQRAGFHDFAVLAGPETGGNASAGHAHGLAYPRGAHYLPLPGSEGGYLRELLADLKLLEGDAHAARPSYAETALVHAPHERLYRNGQWQDSVLPDAHDADSRRFMQYVHALKNRRGRDGKRLFALPHALSSHDAEWRALDRLSFAQWLDANHYRSTALRWYLDYACRDDYGVDCSRVSAWAGLHYFACRNGQAANASDDALLTWPGGLGELSQRLIQPLGTRLHSGMALRISPHAHGTEVLSLAAGRSTRWQVRRVICATPLHVARHLTDLSAFGFDPARHLPPQASWLVGNLQLDGVLPEAPGAPLSWDNVVYQGKTLGFVNASHQLIRAARPAFNVLTSYQALPDPANARHWLAHASAAELRDALLPDLEQVYGWRLYRHARQLEVTVRGHAMAIPTPGFLGNAGLQALRAADGPLQFAHSDLSGFSLAEEALWWGMQAAQRVLGR